MPSVSTKRICLGGRLNRFSSFFSLSFMRFTAFLIQLRPDRLHAGLHPFGGFGRVEDAQHILPPPVGFFAGKHGIAEHRAAPCVGRGPEAARHQDDLLCRVAVLGPQRLRLYDDLHVRGDLVLCRPMAGTAPGQTPPAALGLYPSRCARGQPVFVPCIKIHPSFPDNHHCPILQTVDLFLSLA